MLKLYVTFGGKKTYPLPIGPRVQYAEEKKWDSLQLRIYPVANGKFVLYEDENDGYNYEKGMYATISFVWDDKKKELTMSDRKGAFPGMLISRKFNIVVVAVNKGAGENTDDQPDKVITYTGKKVVVKL